ncbi:hypothetical protein AAG570_001920 [Ranatra chinensis]|uniref:LRRCT domain-containing protein n=1 Tax=Ranatra chinensis TaxID=642074 RepID=A0ABD0Y9X4_9HEMI
MLFFILRPASKVLRSLDLSYNSLSGIPAQAIGQLKALEWLNLYSNFIPSIQVDWGGVRHSLTNLYLGENDVIDLSNDPDDDSLSNFQQLNWLSLDRNKISKLRSSYFPPSLQTLSITNNYISTFPTELIEKSKSLNTLYLRDNFITTIPMYNFKHRKKLEKLDIGENILSSFTPNSFNGTLQVRDMNLDFNDIRVLKDRSFQGLGVGRVYLSRTNLESVSDRAFEGVEDTLEYLDLGGNRLDGVPKGLASLRKLKYLYLPSNNISHLPNDTIQQFAATLSALSLSSNKLDRIPTEALRKCKRLSHLNIGYNHITEILEEDFEGWGQYLDTLLLMNNRIVQIHANTFRHTPRLRELSLSFNKISSIDSEAFVHVSHSLESLEISFGFYQDDFPEEFLKPLHSLLWLALDNNNFRAINHSALYTFKNLQYLNLDGNYLGSIPVGLFNPNIHKYLRDIRLSYNLILSVDPHTFTNMDALQSVVLNGNQIRTIKTNAFRSLSNKVTIILSENKINTISPRAFNDITSLVKLDLQCNELQLFSLSAFQNVSNPVLPMHLNLSRNSISALLVADTMRPVSLHTIDLSHNQINSVPKEFFEAVSQSIKRIYLGYNHINKLDESAFGVLESLQVLTLQHNSVVSLRKRAFVGLKTLQILDMSHNHIEQLHMEQFKCLSHLRVIDLSFNHIRSIPRDAFQNTKLERLDLSHNELVVMPSGSLGEVGFTLRVLDVSHNQIEQLDSSTFEETPLLTGLNLCHNKLTLVPDNVFTSVGGLLRLELCGNRLRANFKELFHYLQSLRELNLAETAMRSPPVLPLPNLVVLNLTGNYMTQLPDPVVETLPNLRSLYIGHCRFQALPSNAWHHLPLLKYLEATRNPIKVVTKDSFLGLERLEMLDISELGRLERLELDSLSGLKLLSSLRVDAWPGLGTIVGGLGGLRRLSVVARAARLGAAAPIPVSPKLRQLEVTGKALKTLEADAIGPLESSSSQLSLQIRDTGLEELPLGLLSGLAKVAHLSLDLRNNRLSSLSPDILYYNLTSWEDVGTKLVSGGLMLEGNPWICDCSLVWVGHWLRRWLRESLELQTAGPEAAQGLMAAVRRGAACTHPSSGATGPLVLLHPQALSCHASPLSGAAARTPPTNRPPLVVWTLLLVILLVGGS